MGWTAPATWTVGELVLASKMNTHVRDNLNALRWLGVRKTADETVNNSITLQNDDHLFFSIAASEVWTFELFIVGATATADLKVGFTAPAGAVAYWQFFPIYKTDGTFGASLNNPKVLADSLGTDLSAGATKQVYLIKGIVRNSTTAGTFQFQWAQNVAVAETTTLYTDSYLTAFRIA